MTPGLDEPEIRQTLDRLHEAAKGDKWVFLRGAPSVIGAVLRGRSVMEGMKPHLSQAYIPISADQGQYMYQTARLIGAKTIVEFGTSFGISSIYLAAAARDNGGRFTGTEMEPGKIKVARENLAAAGLADVSEVRAGDALETLKNFAGPIDMLLLDGWKDIYLPMITMLKPRLKPGAVVFADNIFTFPKDLAPYVAFVRSRTNGFESMTLPLGHGLEYSVYLG
jgi:predicted O-methyltransferase YrrM